MSLKGETGMPNFTLRSLYPEDINQVSEIESSLTGRPRRAFLEKRLAVATTMPDSFITCAVLDDKKLAGYGFARILEGEFGARSAIAVLDDIGVDPGYRGKGIGKMVMSGIERRAKNKNIGTMQTQLLWSNHSMIRFFSSTGFTLAPGQIIERDTSPLDEDVAELAPVKMDGKWRVHSGAGGNHYDKLARDRVLVRSLRGEDIAAVDRIDTKLTGLDRSAYYASKFREMLDESGMPESLLDMAVDFDQLTRAGSMMGSGGMIVLDEATCMVDFARYFLGFLADESCGKCVPCREGIKQMLKILTDITKGKGRKGDIELLEELSEVAGSAALCALGKGAPNPVLSTIRHFRDEYDAHISEGRCPAYSCKELISYYIDPNLCQACMSCGKKCPAGAIEGGKNLIHQVVQDKCTKCGSCLEACPPRFGAVKKISGDPVPPPLPEEARTIVRKSKQP